MGKLIVVVASVLAILYAALLLHKPVYALIVGILVGSFYFLGSLARGGGIAEARITRLPGEIRKPTDPSMGIGMGLAAGGIAAPYMMSANPEISLSIHIWYAAIFAFGLLIALWNAVKTFWLEHHPRPAPIIIDQDDGKM